MPQVLLHILTEPDVCCEVWLHSVPAVSTFAEMRLVVAFLMSVVTVEGWVPCFCTPHPTPPHPHTPTPTPQHPLSTIQGVIIISSAVMSSAWWWRWSGAVEWRDGEGARPSQFLKTADRWEWVRGGWGVWGGGCWDPLISSGKIMWQTNSHTSIHTIRWLGSSNNAAERESLACWY